MTATLVSIPIRALEPAEQAAFDEVLMPLGVHAAGAQGDELILEIMDAERAPKIDFPLRLLEALERPPAAQYWANFRSATYN